MKRVVSSSSGVLVTTIRDAGRETLSLVLDETWIDFSVQNCIGGILTDLRARCCKFHAATIHIGVRFTFDDGSTDDSVVPFARYGDRQYAGRFHPIDIADPLANHTHRTETVFLDESESVETFLARQGFSPWEIVEPERIVSSRGWTLATRRETIYVDGHGTLARIHHSDGRSKPETFVEFIRNPAIGMSRGKAGDK